MKKSKKQQDSQQPSNKLENFHHENANSKLSKKQRGQVEKRREHDERILPFE